MDFTKLLNIVRRYLWLVVLTTVVASVTSYVLIKKEPFNYQARTRLLVGPSLDSPTPDLNSLKIAGQLMQTYAGLLGTQPFLQSVNNKLSEKIDLATLDSMIGNRQNPDTRVLTIVVYSPDPKQAVFVANAVAETLIELSPSKDNTTALLRNQMSDQSHEVELIVSNAEDSIQQLDAKLIALGNAGQQSPEAAKATVDQQNLIIKQLTEERARLSDALRTLATIYQVVLDTNTNQLAIIEPAEIASATNPNIALNVVLAGVSGLLLAVLIIFAAEYFDDRIRFPGDLTRAAKAPLLTTIDKHNLLHGSGLEQVVTFAQPNSRAADSYRMAVAKLLFTMRESKPYTFLVSSVGSQSGDDAAVATANLGVAFAQAGKRVILVDAQFHNPALTELFEANGESGLDDLLTIKSTKLKLIPVKNAPGVPLLPAGLSSEKGLGATLNSANIVKRVEELQKEADVVLVAGSPISQFAESLTLASQVNGVILVARYGEAHSKIVNEVAENLNVMNVQSAGVIFEHNPSPFGSIRKLETKGQANVDTIQYPDLADAVMTADENTESISLDQVDTDTIQPPDTGNLPMPAAEIEVFSLDTGTEDVDPAQSPNLTDSITPTDDITSFEKVTADTAQPRDLEDAAMPADESTELPDLGQLDVDTIQSPDLADAAQPRDLEDAAMPADAATSVNENLEVPNVDQVDVDSAQFPDLHDSAMLSEENLELTLLATGVEETKNNGLMNSKGSHRGNHRKRNRPR